MIASKWLSASSVPVLRHSKDASGGSSTSNQRPDYTNVAGVATVVHDVLKTLNLA
jgi:hypothetical protein